MGHSCKYVEVHLDNRLETQGASTRRARGASSSCGCSEASASVTVCCRSSASLWWPALSFILMCDAAWRQDCRGAGDLDSDGWSAGPETGDRVSGLESGGAGETRGC